MSMQSSKSIHTLSFLILFINFWLIFTKLPTHAQSGIYINNDDNYTNKTQVKIHVKILGTDSLLLSHDAGFPSATWQKAEKEMDWELLPGDGTKELFIKYKDRDGNPSKTIKEKIILDTSPPKNGDVEINNGNNYINFLDNIIIESNIYGADWLMVSEDPNFKSARWEPFYTKSKYNFSEGDGERKLYIKFKDHAGNESEVYEDKVIIDTKPPLKPTIEVKHPEIELDKTTGRKYLNKHNTLVDLQFSVEEGKYMKIANAGAFFGLKWRLFQEQHYDWELGNYKDGNYRVEVIYRDIAKNETQSVYDEITVDTAPPFGEKILINNGDIYTKTSEVNLKITAVDAHQMMLSENKDFRNAKWENYKISRSWKFSKEDGIKKIYIKFKDIAGNESNTASDEIEKDITPPTNGKVVINDGETKTLFSNVHAKAFTDGANFMQISNRPDFAGATWKSYHNSPVFVVLDKSPGTKKVYARFKDDAGNISKAVSSEILQEVKPVDLRLIINENAIYTSQKNRQVSLDIFAKEASEMMISQHRTFADAQWEPYTTEKKWTLTESDGNKQVFVKFKSITGTESETVSDDIILDTSAPIAKEMILNKGVFATFNKKVTVQVQAQEAIYMQVSEDSTFENIPWKGYTNRPLQYIFHNLEGVQTLYARFKDEAGNISSIISGQVKIEINPVSVGMYINNNQEFCTNKNRHVKLHISARSAVEMMVSNKKDFADADWIAYKSDFEWILEEGEGIKKVYAKVKSKTGIISAPMSDDIILDILPPQNTSISINNGEERTTKPIVQLKVLAEEGTISKQISEYPDFRRAKWLPYSDKPFDYFIGNEGGTYTIYARFKDLSGNISEAVSASIIKEIQPHDGQIHIDNDHAFTTNKDKMVEVEVLTVRTEEMIFSESPDFTDAVWQPLDKHIKWQLSDTDGMKSLYVKFRSKTLNESNPIKDEILLDRTPPKNCSVSFSTSAWLQKLNPNLIQVKVSAEDAYKVQVSEYGDFSGRPWLAYTDKPFTFRVSNTENEILLYTRFKDFYGNTSDTIVTSVIVDVIPPTNNTFVINQADQHTKNTTVTINSHSQDAVEMKIANSQRGLKTTEWQPYQEETNWQLHNADDNVKMVFIQYKDKMGNVSQTAIQKIELDRESPVKASIKAKDNLHCKHLGGEFELALYAEGASKMLLSNTPDFSNSAWETYKPNKKWLLTEGDGEKTIYIKFGDEAGNETNVLTINPTLDRVAPEAIKLSINNDATLTNNKKITLELEASQAYEMIISNNGLFGLPAKWEAYQPTKEWYLKGQDEEKTIYVKFRDKAGNESAIIKQQITLDTEAPVVYSLEINKGETMVDGVDVELSLKVKNINGLPDARYLQVSNTNNFSGASWEPFKENLNWRMAGNGLQKVYVRLKDEAGNVSLPFTDNLTVY